MNSLKKNLPMILLIIFELAVGVLLLINAELFTRIIIIVFGVALMAVGVLYLIRSFTDKDQGAMSWIALAVSVVAFVVGVLCTFFSGSIINVFAILAVIYGVILVLSAIFKIKTYFDVKKLGMVPSVFTLISAAVSLVFGVVIILNPFRTVKVLWIFTGICLIVQAAVDVFMLVMKIRQEK